MNNFVHLHVHSEYSLLDGACRIKELAKAAKSMGQQALAITDHGNMFGAVDFYKAAKKEGIKPIIGCEIYVAESSRFSKIYELDSENYHLILLAKNEKGYKNLINIVSNAYIEGFYNRPRADEELLKKHSEGLIALSACLAGKVARYIIKGDFDAALNQAKTYNEIFGDGNFFLELQDHKIPEQETVNKKLLEISRLTGIGLVATNDAHYIRKEDSVAHNVLMCIQMNKTVEDENKMGFERPEFYLKSGEEMASLFDFAPEAIENTKKIADMCEFDFEFGKHFLPEFKTEDGKDNFTYLKELCYDGLKKRYPKADETLIERLEYELDTIRTMGYVDYFLIVHDFIKFARDNDVAVGPGRGSAAGSIVSYCLYITSVDPIKYGLLFERFLNPERVSMPDIDIDFCYEKRQTVIDYVVKKYGMDRVAQIITFGTMAAKAAIRDVGRALNMPYGEVDAIAKLVPNELGVTIESALKKSQQFLERYEGDQRVKRLVDMAKSLEGMPRHASTHAAGVVISKQPLDTLVPLAKNDEAVVTQFTMNTLEELGLLKMDFLGLRTLTIINDATNIIKKNNKNFDIDKIDYSDKKVYDFITSGMTDGVFQLESTGMKAVLRGLKPQNFEDIIAVISLYRPGPMDSIPRYIEWKNNPSLIKYKHPDLEEILKVTYGCVVYQEQVMQIVRKLGGYSFGRADLVRRAMSKKKADVMEKERKNFVYGLTDENGNVEVEGAIRNGVPKEVAIEIFDELMDFASYAFNKSHAAAYAFVAYQTAYLKCHYPKEFMAALLSAVLDSSDKVSTYIGEAKRLNINVLPPDINESEAGFSVSGDNIRFGLVAVKNIGRSFIAKVEEERNIQSFTGFYDFCKRMSGYDLNKRALESLIKSGAMDCFGHKRSQLLSVYESVLDGINENSRRNIDGQTSLFGGDFKSYTQELTLPEIDELPLKTLLDFEKETTGLYMSSHPMREYDELIKRLNAKTINDINSDDTSDGDTVGIVAIIDTKKLKTTKSSGMMAFVGIEDMYGSMEMIVFPKVYECCYHLLNPGSVVYVTGRIQFKEEDTKKQDGDDDNQRMSPKLICQKVTPIEEMKERSKLYLKVKNKESFEFIKIQQIIRRFQGDTQVYIYIEDEKKTVLAKRELWVSLDEDILDELSNILPKDNIKVKKEKIF